MKEPLIVRGVNHITISYNGSKLIEPLERYEGMSNEEIATQYIKVRNIRSSKQRR